MAVSGADLSVIKDAMVFLGSAGIAVPLFHRLRINPILGFMLAGVAVGPHGLGALIERFPALSFVTIADRHRVEVFGELGVVFLLFMIGLDLSMPRLWALRRHVFGLGLAQVVVTSVVIGALASLAGQHLMSAAVLGIALSFSSTAVVIGLLVSQHRFATTEGQIAFSVLLAQDLMVVPALFFVGMLNGDTGATTATAVTLMLLHGIAVVGVLLALAHYTVRPLLRAAARVGSHELFVAVVLLVILATAFATGQAGLTMALGAFVAGLALAESEFRHQIEADIEPFKGLLLGVFFMSVGLNLNLAVVWGGLGTVLAVAVLILLIKAVILFVLAMPFRLTIGFGAEIALLLAHGGEFTLVVVGLGWSGGIIGADTAQIVLASTAISMASVPSLAALGQRLGSRLEGLRYSGAILETSDLDGPVIIGGFGRVGQAVARVLDEEEVPYFALETDPARLIEARHHGQPVFYGDASRADVLLRAGANRARAFVVTLDDRLSVDRMVRSIRQEWPNTPVFARAKDWRHAAHLRRLGVAGVIPEAVEGSLQLAGRVLEGLGYPEEAVAERIAKERAYQRTLHEQDED